MYLRILIDVLVLWLLGATQTWAQYENVWAFGNKAGLDFTTGKPVAIKTGINTREGCASICNVVGQLQFYTDGTSVWNRNHELMPNGKNITGTPQNISASTTQGALIVPIPGKDSQYYIFSLASYEASFTYPNLYYSKVDMTLDGGLGDVTAAVTGVVLDSFLTEEMTAVSGNDCNVWLLVSSYKDPVLKAYNIDINGVHPVPVISPAVNLPAQMIAGMDVAPNRKKLAVGSRGIVLYDFDPQTGRASRPLQLPGDPVNFLNYGLCFSPDNSKLYLGSFGPLFQFDLSLNDAALIGASRTVLTEEKHGGVKRGPDGKIYCSVAEGRPALSVIHQPNLAGIACQYVAADVPLLSGTSCMLGLPNFGTVIVNGKFNHTYADTALCRASLVLNASTPSGIGYTWDNGSTGSSREVSAAGTYWVHYKVKTEHCYDEYADTFVVQSADQLLSTRTLYQGKCKSDTLLMKASNLSGWNYVWEDGSSGAHRSENASGIYSVSYQNDFLCTYYADSFVVSYPEQDPTVSFETDTIVCVHTALPFHNTSDPPFTHYAWTFGNGDASDAPDPVHRFPDRGTYTIRLVGSINSICYDTAYRTVTVDPVVAVSFRSFPERICAGEAISFSLSESDLTVSQLCWQFGDGSRNCTLDAALDHAYDKGGTMPVILQAQFRTCPESSFSDTIYVSELPVIDLGPDTSLCYQSSAFILHNLKSVAPERYQYLWNTGETIAQLPIVHPGTYSLTLIDRESGCKGTDMITVSKNCYLDVPNAFSPNGDGDNDYFFPRQLLSQDIVSFKLQVFNRWGQLMFDSKSLDGRGWDGRYNGIEQPHGVYIYQLIVEFEGIGQQYYRGNVTLIR